MTALQGAVESTAPVSRLHLHQSYQLADFPVPSGREEEWRFTPLRRLPWDPTRSPRMAASNCVRSASTSERRPPSQ